MSKESHPERQPSKKPKAILCFIGSGVLTLTSLGLLRETLKGSHAAGELAMPTFMGGVGLGYYGINLLWNNQKPNDGNGGGGGGGGWEPEPDKPTPSGGGLDLKPEEVLADYVCDPGVQANINDHELQTV